MAGARTQAVAERATDSEFFSLIFTTARGEPINEEYLVKKLSRNQPFRDRCRMLPMITRRLGLLAVLVIVSIGPSRASDAWVVREGEKPRKPTSATEAISGRFEQVIRPGRLPTILELSFHRQTATQPLNRPPDPESQRSG